MTVEIKPYLELDMEFSLTVICEYRSSKSVLRGKKKDNFHIAPKSSTFRQVLTAHTNSFSKSKLF